MWSPLPATVFRQGQAQAVTLQSADELDGDAVIPGFKLPVRKLFEDEE